MGIDFGDVPKWCIWVFIVEMFLLGVMVGALAQKYFGG